MAIKFFGHFLLDEGKLTNEQLTQVVEFQSANNLSLGELAIREKLLTQKQANLINDKQRSLDKRFGEVAISLELLSDEQLVSLLAMQKKEKLFFGDVLILKNIMKKETLNAELARFEVQQKLEVVVLDETIAAIDKDDTIKKSLSILQTIYSRVVHDYIKLVKVEKSTQTSKGILVLQKMRGDIHLDFAFQPIDPVALAISSKFLKMDFESVDEMVLDIVSEFLNVVLGNIAVKFSEESVKVDLKPPLILEPKDFDSSEFYSFDFVTTQGELRVYLKI